MNRRDVLRGTLVGVIGAASLPKSASALVFPAGYDASKDLAKADWKPVFLDAHQNETLIAFSDIIIPEGDAPGAKSALANRFLDLLMAAEEPSVQGSFFNCLAYIDGISLRSYKRAFVYLPRETQIELVTSLAYPRTLETWGEHIPPDTADYEHFSKLKNWIALAYWNSEAGQRALGWNGEPPHGTFEGCTHSSGSHSK